MSRLSGNEPHLSWRGEPPGFSRVAAGALDLGRDLRDPLWWPQERPVPMRVARGPLGIPLPSMPVLRPCVETVSEPEDSSPVLTWILGYVWSLPMGVSPRLEWGHVHALSSPAVAAVSRFPSRGTRDLGHSLEAFPKGFPPEAFPQGCPTCHRVVSRSSA